MQDLDQAKLNYEKALRYFYLCSKLKVDDRNKKNENRLQYKFKEASKHLAESHLNRANEENHQENEEQDEVLEQYKNVLDEQNLDLTETESNNDELTEVEIDKDTEIIQEENIQNSRLRFFFAFYFFHIFFSIRFKIKNDNF